MMSDIHSYDEKLSSSKTETLFVALMVLFLLLFAWRFVSSGNEFPAVIFLLFFIFFTFYSLNYRTLVIRMSPGHLILKFGIFKWSVPFDNIENCYLDNISMLRVGGAGIHFTTINGKYRAFFNFLEYPRVVITLRKKKGPVREIAFSTIHPEEVMGLIQEAITKE